MNPSRRSPKHTFFTHSSPFILSTARGLSADGIICLAVYRRLRLRLARTGKMKAALRLEETEHTGTGLSTSSSAFFEKRTRGPEFSLQADRGRGRDKGSHNDDVVDLCLLAARASRLTRAEAEAFADIQVMIHDRNVACPHKHIAR